MYKISHHTEGGYTLFSMNLTTKMEFNPICPFLEWLMYLRCYAGHRWTGSTTTLISLQMVNIFPVYIFWFCLMILRIVLCI